MSHNCFHFIKQSATIVALAFKGTVWKSCQGRFQWCTKRSKSYPGRCLSWTGLFKNLVKLFLAIPNKARGLWVKYFKKWIFFSLTFCFALMYYLLNHHSAVSSFKTLSHCLPNPHYTQYIFFFCHSFNCTVCNEGIGENHVLNDIKFFLETYVITVLIID